MICKVSDNSSVKALNENVYICWFCLFLPLLAEKREEWVNEIPGGIQI